MEGSRGPSNAKLLDSKNYPTDEGREFRQTVTTDDKGKTSIETLTLSHGELVARSFTVGIPWPAMVELAQQVIEANESLATA